MNACALLEIPPKPEIKKNNPRIDILLNNSI